MSKNIKKIPIKEGLVTVPATPDEKPRLIGCRCPSCGEIFFPKRELCQNCQERNLPEITLSRNGKIYSFATVMQPPASHYKGPVPYSLGWVELPEGIRVETLFTGCDPQRLKIGMKAEMVLEKLHDDDEGNEIICHKFRPIEE